MGLSFNADNLSFFDCPEFQASDENPARTVHATDQAKEGDCKGGKPVGEKEKPKAESGKMGGIIVQGSGRTDMSMRTDTGAGMGHVTGIGNPMGSDMGTARSMRVESTKGPSMDKAKDTTLATGTCDNDPTGTDAVQAQVTVSGISMDKEKDAVLKNKATDMSVNWDMGMGAQMGGDASAGTGVGTRRGTGTGGFFGGALGKEMSLGQSARMGRGVDMGRGFGSF